jgi:D-glycero-D-manno-heptose 1,7-bisphosphate phosphatase
MVSRACGLVPAVFLDRDGVIVIPEVRDGRSYAPRRLADFRIYPEAGVSLERLKRAGFLLAVVTNQPDVGNGLLPRSEVEAMHEIMRRDLCLDAIETCFHRQGDGCACRKPKPGMILGLAETLGIDLEVSFMVGDRASDVAAGRAAGCRTVFIDRGYAEPAPSAPDHVVYSIAQAADAIIGASVTLQETP